MRRTSDKLLMETMSSNSPRMEHKLKPSVSRRILHQSHGPSLDAAAIFGLEDPLGTIPVGSCKDKWFEII